LMTPAGRHLMLSEPLNNWPAPGTSVLLPLPGFRPCFGR